MIRSDPSHAAPAPIAAIVEQHVDDAAHLRHVRSVLVRAPNVRLAQIGRHDERLAASLDGIAVAGRHGADLVRRSLEHTSVGTVFVVAVRAIEERDGRGLDTMIAVAAAEPSLRPGLLSAFGWVSLAQLQGIVESLLDSEESWRRQVGLAACAMHGVDPGEALFAALRDNDATLRVQALRTACRCASVDALDSCLALLADEDPQCRLQAARSALMLGASEDAIDKLEVLARDGAPADSEGQEAMWLLLQAVPISLGRSILADWSRSLAPARALFHGIAMLGDPHYVPWLIAQMRDDKLARAAGEACSFITGWDLARLDLDRPQPKDVNFGPNDDPDDRDVAMDEDESLPWPDADRVAAWWSANGRSFHPGTRYFIGVQPTLATCIQVLKSGYQRQRIAAARQLTLLSVGTPWFNTAAPAWRQLRLLGAWPA